MHYINCKGRYSVKGKIECVDKFEHIGNWGDKELVVHQKKEKDLDCKQHWWTGYDSDKKFESLKDSYNYATKETG